MLWVHAFHVIKELRGTLRLHFAFSEIETVQTWCVVSRLHGISAQSWDHVPELSYPEIMLLKWEILRSLRLCSWAKQSGIPTLNRSVRIFQTGYPSVFYPPLRKFLVRTSDLIFSGSQNKIHMFLTWPPMTAKLWNVLWRQRWTRGSGWVHPENSADMPELGYEKLLVRAGWAISLALSIQARKQSFHLEWPPIQMLRSSFQLEWVHIIWTS